MSSWHKSVTKSSPTALGGLDFLLLPRVRYMVFWAFQPSHGQLEKARSSIEVLFESSTAPLSTLTLALFLARLFSIRFTNLSGQLVNIIRSQIHRHHHGLFGFSDGTAPAVSGVSAASARDARCPIIPHVMHALMQLPQKWCAVSIPMAAHALPSCCPERGRVNPDSPMTRVGRPLRRPPTRRRSTSA